MSEDMPDDVRRAFDAMPDAQRAHALQLRSWILDVAADNESIGELVETLKWGEPSYLPVKPRVGSTVRIASFDADAVGLYFNCQTMLVENFRHTYGDDLEYSKNRAVVFRTDIPLNEQVVKQCASAALLYHRNKA